jgi:hypothetical protein
MVMGQKETAGDPPNKGEFLFGGIHEFWPSRGLSIHGPLMSIFNKFSHKEHGKIILVRALKKIIVLLSDIYLIGLSSRLSRVLLSTLCTNFLDPFAILEN